LDAVLMKVAVALNALDISRLGVLLSGFCYRSTPQIDVGFINSVLKDLYTKPLQVAPWLATGQPAKVSCKKLSGDLSLKSVRYHADDSLFPS